MSSTKKLDKYWLLQGLKTESTPWRYVVAWSTVCIDESRQSVGWEIGEVSQVSYFNIFFYGIKNNNEGIIKLMIQHQEVELFHKLLQILCLFQYRNQQI